MRTIAVTIALGLALGGAGAGEARAQAAPAVLRTHAFELDLGGAWLAGAELGGADATLVRNQSVRSPYTLFSTTSTLGSAPGAEGRIGYHLARALSIEGGVLFGRPSLRTEVSGDAEGAPSLIATETISQFLVDVSGVLHLTSVHLGRGVPFVLGGAGYLRELHQGQVLAQSGHTYHLGAGAKIPLVSRRGFIRVLGLRVDSRLYFRSGGADLDAAAPTRTTLTAGASVLVQF